MSNFPHRDKLLALLIDRRDSALSEVPLVDKYAGEKLKRYAEDMQKQIDLVQAMPDSFPETSEGEY